ncbi:MAG TPA: 3-hydroxyacyl-CoA dehydrogenase NAD-binding domain-containing protein [Candidatus Ozemobacteraceae bacterium]
MMSQKLVVVFGIGPVGQGLAQAVATSGCDVVLIDESAEKLQEALGKISQALDSEIARWGLTEGEKKGILGRIRTSTDMKEASKASHVIETIPEGLEVKRDLFRKLDGICPVDTLLISNSATSTVTDLSHGMKYPGRLIGMHFLNPVRKTPVVEVSRGIQTSDASFETAKRFAKMLDKTVIQVYEYPGLVTTRVFLPMLNQAAKVLNEGIAGCEDIDTAMKLGFGLNMGPFALADQMGIDALLSWMEQLHHETNDNAFLPSKLIRKMVRAGLNGIKSGRGFYRYGPDGRRIDGSGLSIGELSAPAAISQR